MSETQKAKETVAWLVEIQPTGGPQWWTGRGDEWTPYVDGTQMNPTLSAIRFAREEDANRAIGWLLDKGAIGAFTNPTLTQEKQTSYKDGFRSRANCAD